MSSKLMLMGAASALLVSFACGCAAETGSEEGTGDEATPADEKTATEQSPIVYGNGGDRTNPRDTWNRGRGDDRGDYRPEYRRNPPGYNPPGYSPYSANPPGYNPPGTGRGYAGGYGRRYNNPPGNYDQPGYNPPGYNPYAPAYNPPGYNAPGAW
jgi:hypothetical protein